MYIAITIMLMKLQDRSQCKYENYKYVDYGLKYYHHYIISRKITNYMPQNKIYIGKFIFTAIITLNFLIHLSGSKAEAKSILVSFEYIDNFIISFIII